MLSECRRRNISLNDESYRWDIYQNSAFNSDYQETGKEKQIIINRISEKIKNSPKEYFHYYHKQISKEEAIELLKNKTSIF